MSASASRIWVPRSGQCVRTPFRTGIDRALADAFPPTGDAPLPERIAAALLRLEDALRAPSGGAPAPNPETP